MAAELHWDAGETEQQLDHYRQLCAAEEAAAHDHREHIALSTNAPD